jgi:hypothetical protein
MQLIVTYTYSNGLYIQIYQIGPKKFAKLFSADKHQLLEGNPSFSAAPDILATEILLSYDTINIPSLTSTVYANSSKPTEQSIWKQYNISGRVIDKETFSNIEGIKISITTKTNSTIYTKTDKDGIYSLSFSLNVDSNEVPIEKPDIQYSDSNNKYSSQSIKPFNLDGTLKEPLDIVQMVLAKQDIELTKQQQKQKINVGTNNILKTSKKSAEEFLIDFIKNSLTQLISVFLPAILNLLVAFGIDALNNLLSNSVCPKKTKLDEVIKLRNKLVSDLNSLSKTLDTLIVAIGVVDGLLKILSITVNLFFAVPIPVTFVPQGIITLASDSVRKFQNLLSKFKSINATVLMALMILKFVLAVILSLLQNLDKLIKQCDPSAQLTELDDNLKTIQNEVSIADNNIINPLVNKRIVNGFELDVQTVDNLNGLLSKQAIGKDSKGVILIKGESSYSYDSNVLIDELEFYILKNNLKAY